MKSKSIIFLSIFTLFGASCGDDDDDNGGGGLTCSDVCPEVVAAGCTNGPSSISDCESGCAEVRNLCTSKWNTVIACSGDDAAYSCDANDMVYPEGCQTQQDKLNACITAMSDICAILCPNVVAAACTNGPSTILDCEAGCEDAETNCPTQFENLIQCSGYENVTFSCNTEDAPYPDGCQSQQDSLYDCTN